MSPPVPRHRVTTTVLLVALLAAGLVPGAATLAAVPQDSTLQRLASLLALEPESVQADFAAIALGEVLIAHELEFERLSLPGQVSRREQAKQLRWAGALRRYLDTLYAAREALDGGAPVEILVTPPSPVQLLVGEHLVPLSSPRIENPQELDGAIVQLYCDTFACNPDLLEPEPPPVVGATGTGGWSFREGFGSTYETDDGLGFMFSDVRGRNAKEQAVRRVHEELKRLVAVVATARRRGRRVDFARVRVAAAGRGDDHRVILAPGTPGVRVFLPALMQAPGVVEVARDWIRAQADGRHYRQLFPRADLLLAGVMKPPPAN